MTLSVYSDRVVLPGADGLKIAPALIRVEGTTITQVEQSDRSSLPAEDLAAATDLEDAIVAPAFIDGHTHLPMVAFRGIGGSAAQRGDVIKELYFRLETSLDASAVRAFTRLCATESLLSGVGLVWDHYYWGTAVAEGLADVGLAGVVTPTLQDLEGPGVPWLEGQINATLEIAQSASLREAGVYAGFGPHATNTVSDTLWQRIVKLANTHSLPVHAHVAQSLDEYKHNLTRHELTPVARLQQLGVLDVPHLLAVHGIYIAQEDLTRFNAANNTLGFCPYSQLQFCFPAHVGQWTRANVPWLIATDCAVSNDAMNVQKELRLVAGMRLAPTTTSPAYAQFRGSGALSDAEAAQSQRQVYFDRLTSLADTETLLSRVWQVPGRMHPSFRAGVIAPGALANLQILNPAHPCLWPSHDILRNLTLCDTSPAIDGMLVAGCWVGQRGRFHDSLVGPGSGYAEIRRDADRALARLGIHN